MKKFLMSAIAATLLSFGNTAIAVTPAIDTGTTTNQKLPTSTIDGIEVPYDVLEYVQLKYQGFAVTGAFKSSLNGQSMYVLRADNEDVQSDNKSIHLTYNMQWELIDDKKVTTPKIQKPVQRFEYEEPEEEDQEPEPEVREEKEDKREEKIRERQRKIEERVEEEIEEIEDDYSEEEDDESPRGPGNGRWNRD